MKHELKQLVEQPHTKENAEKLAHWFNEHPEDIKPCLELLQSTPVRRVQLISWGIGKITSIPEQHLHPHWRQIIELIKHPAHPSVRRNLLKISSFLSFKKLTEEQLGEIWDLCIRIMENRVEPSSHHAYSMSIMEQLIYIYPELFQEFSAVLQLHEENMSAAVRSRKKHIMRRLKNNIS